MAEGENNVSMEETVLASVFELSDEDMVINYCLQNKVSKIAIDELLKLGFSSLEALRLGEYGRFGRT